MRVLIIGAGEIGSAIGAAIGSAGHEVWFYDRNPEKRTPGKDPNDMFAECDCVFICVPSTGLREAAMLIYKGFAPGKPVVVLTKGMESGSHKTSNEVLKDILPKNPIVVLGGPMLAEEIRSGKEAAGVMGSEDMGAYAEAASLFNGTKIFIERTEDVGGLALCGVLKNIYSLAFGFAEGIGEESNIKGFLTAESLKEMVGIAGELGYRAETVIGPGGLGDLVASGMSLYGYNRRAGKELLEKGKTDLISEGALSIGSVIARLGDGGKNYKLLSTIQRIILHPKEGKEIFEDYLREKIKTGRS